MFIGSNIHVGTLAGRSSIMLNEQWKKCVDDTDAAVLSPATTAVDYAWLCLASVWVKCYNANATAATATDPSVLEQCDAVPAQCADLVGWPASDDFSGTGCNSGSIGDTNYSIRWTASLPGSASIQIASASLQITSSSAGEWPAKVTLKNPLISGNFSISVDLSTTFPTLPTGSQVQAILTVIIGSNTYNAGVWQSNGTAGDDGYFCQDPAGFSISATANISGTATISRTGSTVTISCGTVTRYYTDSGNVNASGIELKNNELNTTGTLSAIATFDNFVCVDGSNNPIYIDPSGVACT